jgi:AraC-like DNA-binding protein
MAKQKIDMVAIFPGIVIIHQKIPNHEVGRHEHSEHEFFLPIQGEITVEYNDVRVKSGPGKMLYVPPNLDHSFSSTSQGSGERVIWLVDDKLWRKHTKNKYEIMSVSGNSLVKELIFFLLIHQKIEGVKYFISALVESLGESLNAGLLNQNSIFSDHIDGKITDDRVKKSMQLMNDLLAEVPLTKVAEESGLSLRNFNRLFLQQVGMTPKNYLMLRRVEKAKTLLKETRMTVTDISFEIGYNSLSKFIEIFKRFEGVLPSDFRANVIRK